MLDTISADRIRNELEHIFEEKRPELVVRRLGDLGVLHRINPSLKGDGWIAKKFGGARRLKKPSQLPSLYFCLLVYSLSERDIEKFLARLNMPAELSRAMRDTLRLKTSLPLLDKPSLKPSRIYYLLKEYEPLAIQANAIATESSAVHRHLQLFLAKLRYVKTVLNGEDLQRLGVPKGPQMGKTLEMLHKARLDGEVRNRAEETKLALSLSLKLER
jgi:tRNA nucleotidyltransferase (CCA-adding enzyme)